MKKRSQAINTVWTVILTILSLAWVYPVVVVLINSFKKDSAISTNTAFQLPPADGFAGLGNYANAIHSKGFLAAFFNSFIISVTSVVLILVCCSMCAWFITRVKTWATKLCYFLFVFSMVVPFQMLMFTLANLADKTKLNTPFNICIIYLGFGAGLAVFMFTGFVKSIPLEIEEAAMIDGCGNFGVLRNVIVPMAKPGIVTVCMITAMSAWNEFPVALIMLTDETKKTMPIGLATLYEQQRYATDWGALFAALILALIPTILLFLIGQKQLLRGTNIGGIKG